MIVKESDNGSLVAHVTGIDVLNEFSQFNKFEILDRVADELRSKIDFLAEDRWKLVIGRYPEEDAIAWEISDPSLQVQIVSMSGLQGHIELKNGLPVLA